MAQAANLDKAKKLAAEKAAALVESGMKVGLGSGSTAVHLVERLGVLARDEGLKIDCAATSTRTADLARKVGLKVHDLDALGRLDLTIDGADEIDPQFNLIKGGGGALLQEKIVAAASDRMVAIADSTKLVDNLGAYPLPVEVIPFGRETTARLIGELLDRVDVRGKAMTLRKSGDKPFVTDCGHHILDLALGFISNPRQLSTALNQIPGVVENGLFIGLCDTIIIAYPDGRTLRRERDGDGNLFGEDR